MSLAAMFPGDYYSQDLAKSGDFMGYFDHQRQKQEAFKNQELNRQGFLEDLMQKQQQFPLEQAIRQGTISRNAATLPGITAESDLKRREADVKLSIPMEEQRKTILSKLASDLSEQELKSEENQIRQQLLRTDLPPQVRQGLEFARDQFQDIYKLRLTLGNKQSIEEYKVDNRPPPRVAAPRTGGAGGAPKAPTLRTDEQTAQYWQLQADTEQDPAKKAELQLLATAARQRMLDTIQAREDAKKAGGIDLSATGVAVRPGIGQPAAPAKPAAAPTAAPKAPTGRVALRGPDGKWVSVPEGQVDAAIAQGYKR